MHSKVRLIRPAWLTLCLIRNCSVPNQYAGQYLYCPTKWGSPHCHCYHPLLQKPAFDLPTYDATCKKPTFTGCFCYLYILYSVSTQLHSMVSNCLPFLHPLAFHARQGCLYGCHDRLALTVVPAKLCPDGFFKETLL